MTAMDWCRITGRRKPRRDAPSAQESIRAEENSQFVGGGAAPFVDDGQEPLGETGQIVHLVGLPPVPITAAGTQFTGKDDLGRRKPILPIHIPLPLKDHGRSPTPDEVDDLQLPLLETADRIERATASAAGIASSSADLLDAASAHFALHGPARPRLRPAGALTDEWRVQTREGDRTAAGARRPRWRRHGAQPKPL